MEEMEDRGNPGLCISKQSQEIRRQMPTFVNKKIQL